MNEAIQELLQVDYSLFLSTLTIIIVGLPMVKKALDTFEKESKIVFPWTVKKRELNQRFEAIEKKIVDTRKEIDEKIENIHKAEHDEHETWHQQSINIRDNLTKRQTTFEENQARFMETLASISASLVEIKADLLDERLERKRWNILNCAGKLRNGECVDYEEFNNVFQDYDTYEDLIKKNGLTNGLIEESIKFIREKYQESLCKEK